MLACRLPTTKLVDASAVVVGSVAPEEVESMLACRAPTTKLVDAPAVVAGWGCLRFRLEGSGPKAPFAVPLAGGLLRTSSLIRFAGAVSPSDCLADESSGGGTKGEERAPEASRSVASCAPVN